MYHTFERMYNIIYYAFQWLGIAVFFLYLTSLILYVPPITSVSHNTTSSIKAYRKSSFSDFTIDLDVDFTQSFNWNTKMIFVWVKASFIDEKIPHNTATVWDTMIRKKERAHLQLTNERIEYPLVSVHNNLLGKEVNLTVEWMVIPWSGATTVEHGNSTTFVLPTEFSK
ncbi:microsomal signal peptidase 23 kD subunit, putative [Entamoeba dispar SAW760]|uniref:Signal peptidase complex subunit 3 n=1 Tax=Entamoeba dispar (strain ATCC PRA-260 / SAW760) TaxID=370354 RepID=B0ER12_ENTDS|nr:microsomal signal peptidase 23 kD subunit, putative [Entamoeba dispar SAW760]EDR23021.1 microsomal signal peptidase 23 kD subunit, putative [Entamoeba dispar SAW760]|eukprot:EDR23021.1 microsomal signal peptidase 23 kD subunit, putative [Entamoeba dispar SAW760]